MAEIEKKYSDYQKSECEDLKRDPDEQVIDPKICPTCTPNPDFKLQANWWEIKEGYLNEAECEYHIRVYETEAEKERNNRIKSGDSEAANLDLKEDIAFDVGITKLLIDLGKPVNDVIKQQLIVATYSLGGATDTHDSGNPQYKKAWRIRIPAFNFDQIDSLDSENSEETPTPYKFSDEIILKTENLNRDIKRMVFALKTFSQFYSMAQETSNKFVIRQENDPILRIDYKSASQKLKKFKKELNMALLSKGYPKIQNTGSFKSKKALKIKLTFEEGEAFKLKNIWALPDDGCEKYENLHISPSSELRSPTFNVLYNFLRNFDSIISDLTAAQEKPWLDWTLEYFYPKYIVDYGGIESIENTKAGLECLLENQLGLGDGKIVDSITSEIMSAFAFLEEQLADQACRSLEDKVLRPNDVLNPEDPDAMAEKERILKEKYRKKFENKTYKEIKKFVNKIRKEQDRPNVESYEEAVQVFIDLPQSVPVFGTSTVQVPPTVVVELSYTKQDANGKKVKEPVRETFTPANFEDKFEKLPSLYADAAYNASKEMGFSFGQEVLMSEDYQLGLKALRETIDFEDNSFLAAIKESNEDESDFDLIDLIPTIGLCGMTKTAGKALECLLKGVPFDDFLSVLIEKTFDFMEVNTFSLFFNGIPVPIRKQINEAVAKEFGPSMNIETLFGIKNSGEGSDKLKDFLKSKQKGKEILRILKKNPTLSALSAEDNTTINSIIPPPYASGRAELIQIMRDAGYDHAKGSFNPPGLNRDGKIELPKPTDTTDRKMYKPEKWALKSIKQVIKRANTNDETFTEAVQSIYNSVADWTVDTYKNIEGSLDKLSEQKKEDRAERNQEFLDSFGEPGFQFSDVGAALGASAEYVYQSAIDSADRMFPNVILEEEDVDIYQKSLNSINETALGVKVDIVFDIVFTYLVDYIMDLFSIDELFDQIKSYPVVDFLLDKVQSILLANCPKTPIINPPPEDMLKGLTVDFCDPTTPLALPVINIPSINYRFQIELKLSEKIRQLLTDLYIKAAMGILIRVINTLEGSLCNLLEGVGGFVAEGIRDGTLGQNINDASNRFLDSLNEAFCNDSQNSETLRDKAEELADALFSPLVFDSGDYSSGTTGGSSNKVANIISSVATKDEFLEAMVAREGETNQQFNKRISNAIQALAPEAEALLGSPNQVAYFFRNLGSYLTLEDKDRIRGLLEAGIPNLPISDAICLTNDQLDEWNKLRENLLSDFPNPDEMVRNLNDQTLAALEDAMDDIGDLETDGPFIGPLVNELGKDVCNPENVFNTVSTDDLSKAQDDELAEAFYDNITRSLTKGFSGKNGILGEALADKEGRKEFSRAFRKIFNPNYRNSQTERNSRYENKTNLGQFVMDVLTDDEDGDGNGDAVGVYPATVAMDQREQILGSESKSFNFSRVKEGKKSAKNIVFQYHDEQDAFKYNIAISVSNLRRAKKVFGYNLQVIEKVNEEQEYVELNINTPIKISKSEDRYMQSMGFYYSSNSEKDIRKAAFNSILQKLIPINKSYDSLFEQTFEMTSTNIVEGIMSNYDSTETLPGGFVNAPSGYTYGYINETLTKESFTYYNPDGTTEYNLDESDKTLGKYGHSRIVVLDPKLYGGRYSNPPYFVEPRQFTGWMEIGTKAFTSAEGCDPKKPPLISFQDIANRTKMLKDSLKTDPRLSQDPDCASVKPFHLLIDPTNKSRIDGVVRTTIRAYIAEIYLKAYGLFSNIEARQENFDSAFSNYIVSKMKSEMSELGTTLFSKRISIKQDRYWYTFLEQAVEAYQRSIDIDGVNAPTEVMKALTKIQRGMNRYVPIDKDIKKLMRDKVKKDGFVKKPDSDYDPIYEVSREPEEFGLQAVAFRLTTDEEEKKFFFNGRNFEDIKANDIRFASLKKLRFFQKIYFIKLFEREATLIMSEIIAEELKRFGEILVDGVTDKPYYRDLFKSFLGMKSFFPSSSSRIGLNKFYIDKQTGDINTGTVPDVSSDLSTAPVLPESTPQFVVERYIRIKDKEEAGLPSVIVNRPSKLRGVASLKDVSEFIGDNLNALEGSMLSDFFGDLSFTYRVSYSSLLEKGLINEESISRLYEINIKNTDVVKNQFKFPTIKGGGFSKQLFLAGLRASFKQYIMGEEVQDFEVLCDDSFFALDENKPNPFATTGEMGIKYGLRVCMVFPTDFFNPTDIQRMSTNAEFSNLSKSEKAYLYNDGSFMLPISSAEVEVIDTEIENFDPFDGTEKYDLECLVNKIVSQPSFTTMFDKILNIRQAASMTAIYAVESFMPSLGRSPLERTENYLESLDYEDSWDGTVNKFAKNFLRREFASLYLSNTFDGQSANDDSREARDLLNLSNPLRDFFSFDVNIPWWVRRRLKTKVYDANGVECANPAKDLT